MQEQLTLDNSNMQNLRQYQAQDTPSNSCLRDDSLYDEYRKGTISRADYFKKARFSDYSQTTELQGQFAMYAESDQEGFANAGSKKEPLSLPEPKLNRPYEGTTITESHEDEQRGQYRDGIAVSESDITSPPTTYNEDKNDPQGKTNSTKPKKVIINVVNTRYDSVKDVAKRKLKWKLSIREDFQQADFDLFWSDTGIYPERLAMLKPYMKVNHFPGMHMITRKNHLGRILKRLHKMYPDDFKFFPMTWMLPYDFHQLKNFCSKRKTPISLIVKPEAGSQGKGIFITRRIDELANESHMVVQRYLRKPYLIDGLKFDLRLYVLVTSCEPLRIFLFKEGLARFATEPYETSAPLQNVFMHLTNYAINKESENFVNGGHDFSSGSKRSLQFVWGYLQKRGVNVQELHLEIRKVIVKTLMMIQPHLSHIYRACQPRDRQNSICFQILGFDILLDSKAKPWLLEVNQAPSFNTDTPLDARVKINLLHDSFRMLNLSQEERNRKINEAYQQQQKRMIEGFKEANQIKTENAQRQRQLLNDHQEREKGDFERIFPPHSEDQRTYYVEIGKKIIDFWNNDRRTLKSHAAVVARKEERTHPSGIKPELLRQTFSPTRKPDNQPREMFPSPDFNSLGGTFLPQSKYLKNKNESNGFHKTRQDFAKQQKKTQNKLKSKQEEEFYGRAHFLQDYLHQIQKGVSPLFPDQQIQVSKSVNKPSKKGSQPIYGKAL